MIWRILGPVEIVAQGRALEIGRPQQRAVLAYLLLNEGHLVRVDQLVTALWANAPPAGAHRQVRVRVSQLRSALRGAGLTDALAGGAGGYRLTVDEGRFDAAVFAAQVETARAELATRPARAAELLRAGLRLWRGPALAGAAGEFVETAAARLQEQQLSAYEQLADAELALGRHEELVSLLRPVVDEYPLRERVVGQLMLALAGCGRQADALSLYAQTRAQLCDELGVEPTAALVDAHVRVLRQQVPGPRRAEPSPLPTSLTDVQSRSRRTPSMDMSARINAVPAQLPADVAGFTGRAAALQQLDVLLRRVEAAPQALTICTIQGSAGVGKTALAVHWSHRVSGHFPDGQLYVNLHGFDPTGRVLSAADALRGVLEALHVPAERLPNDPAQQAALLRSLLAGRRVLLVLDNARDADHVRPLVPGTAGSFVVVTSRSQLSSLVAIEGAHPLSLDLLSVAEARDMLARRLGAHRVAAEAPAVDEIIHWCARLPLALAIVAARATVHASFPLATLAAELRDGGGLDALNAGDSTTDVRSVFSWSYQTLRPSEARLFRLLSLHPGPDVTPAAAASLSGAPLATGREQLALLARAHLVNEDAPGRYAFHDLLRAYADELCRTHDSKSDRDEARRRLFDHYLHSARAVHRLLHPHRGDPASPASIDPDTVLADVGSGDRASAWLAAERRVLKAVVDLAAHTGFERHACQLAYLVAIYLDYCGYWHDLAAVHGAALAAAQRMADAGEQARAHLGLAHAYTRLGRCRQAHTERQSALHQYLDLGDQTGQARTHLAGALTYLQEGRIDESLEQATRALDLFRQLGNRIGQADALNNIGWCRTQLGHDAEALACCQRAVDLHLEIGDEHGQANAWDSLGYAHHNAGQHSLALACYERALGLFGTLGDRRHEALTLCHLGDTHLAAGRTEAARSAWQSALAILGQLGHPDTAELRAKLSQLSGNPAVAKR